MLSPRQQSILHRVIDTYIDTAQPVGSHFITELFLSLYRDSYSPATVRHEMGILEEKGYLTHPHTSAGRVPTDRGYRFYVDHGLREESVAEDSFDLLRHDVPHAAEELEPYAEKVSDVLSSLADQISLVFLPPPAGGARGKLFIQGSSLMLEKPEFRELEKARMILKTLEAKDKFSGWLREHTAPEGVSVSIGSENQMEAFTDCAVLSASIRVQGEPLGIVGVLGPRRMRYARAVPLVTRMTRLIERAFNYTF